MTTELEFHEVTSLFPMMTEEQYEAFKADIKRNGLYEPIVLYKGKIIDGRCRYKACMELGITPRYQELPAKWHEKLVDYLISCNLLRQHFTPSQRTAIAEYMGLEAEKGSEENMTMELKHTADPWKIRPDYCNDIIAGNCLIHVTGEDETHIDEIEANAKLIAAAPELLDVAIDIYNMMVSIFTREKKIITRADISAMIDNAERLEGVINKATGDLPNIEA